MTPTIEGGGVPGRFDSDILGEGQRVLNAEVVALGRLRLGMSFVRAVRLIGDRTEGSVITTGVGKSGLVAQRIAATFTITGIPAWYLHAGDAGHGDIGKVTASDTVLMVSRSGEGEELLQVARYAANIDIPIVLITANTASTLGQWANMALLYDGKEACRYGLTPTSSSTSASVLGDALALALQQYRGFGPKDFAALHNSGTLGRRLKTTVRDVMVTKIGQVAATSNLYTALIALAQHRGTVLVYPQESGGELLGVVTAGDVARCCKTAGKEAEYRMNCWDVTQIMTQLPKWISPEALVVDAIEMMQQAGVMALPVLGDGEKRVVGMVHLHDALKARVQ